MARQPLPPVAAALAFVDRINHTDVAGLTDLLTDDHRLEVDGAEPVVGRAANADAWTGHVSAFPDYVVYPHRIVEIVRTGGRVALLGHTTGSHLGLPDAEEARLRVIWVADVRDGRLSRWQVLGDSPELRREFGLGD